MPDDAHHDDELDDVDVASSGIGDGMNEDSAMPQARPPPLREAFTEADSRSVSARVTLPSSVPSQKGTALRTAPFVVRQPSLPQKQKRQQATNTEQRGPTNAFDMDACELLLHAGRDSLSPSLDIVLDMLPLAATDILSAQPLLLDSELCGLHLDFDAPWAHLDSSSEQLARSNAWDAAFHLSTQVDRSNSSLPLAAADAAQSVPGGSATDHSIASAQYSSTNISSRSGSIETDFANCSFDPADFGPDAFTFQLPDHFGEQ